MPQNNTNQPNSPDEPSQNNADPNPPGSKPPGTQKGPEPKKRDWRDWVLIFVAAATLANGAAEISEIGKLNILIEQHSAISEPDIGLAKRDLLTHTEAQVREIREFFTRNRDEITSVDHYNNQLTLHAQTAIDCANEAISKSPEDVLTKAIKERIDGLESELGPEPERRRKRSLEELIDVANGTLDLIEMSKRLSALCATETRPSRIFM